MAKAAEVIKIAEAEVGYLEKETNKSLYSKTANAGDENYTKYANDFDKKYPNFYNGRKNGYAWCDVFVDWCFVKAFGETKALSLLGQPKKSYGAGCEWSAKYFKQINRFYKSPKVGDQIFFSNSRGEACHTGLVYKVDASKVYTIEGNTSSASGVVANGGAVAKKSYSLSYSRIYGYGRPKYDVEEATKPATTTKPATADKRVDSVLEVQYWLNNNYAAGLTPDGLYGRLTKAALVKALQKELGFTGKDINGIFGAKTKAAVKNLRRGDKGNLVKVLQGLLVCNGYKGAYVDGDFGTGTEDAVTKYQRQKALEVDGIAGKETFASLCR